ncbi:MAG: protein-glutamate O-methyltransferase CheR [Candidatus Gastranaerophilales bacterium]|nr:protein-glutamate O-methyltransferase CheR [Candidatus Gastranaerophilales bacterium]
MENKPDFNQTYANLLGTTPMKIPSAADFIKFKKDIAALINLDLTNYKTNQMERRIVSLMNRLGIEVLDDYLKILKCESNRLEEFLNMLTINVSEFFRNSEKFLELESIYIPELLNKHSKLKIWSAGCSIGAEIYSLAMILDKHDLLDKCDLLASDFDLNILKKAREGIYNKFEVGTIPKDYEKYINKISEDKFQINSKLISKIRFEKQDLLNSRYEKDFDLILCRNVVIYFTEEAKEKLYKNFYNSLKSGGILFIGSTERINNHRSYGYNLKTSFFYEK